VSARTRDLWSLVWGKPTIDPTALAEAIDEAARGELDYRTRLLIRDAVDALEDYWGPERCGRWLSRSGAQRQIDSIRGESFDKVGFPFLREALMEPTRPDEIRQLLRELGMRLHKPASLVIGGSCALILEGRLSRATQDVDVVDEIPAEIREQHELLDELRQRYRLALTHFQSHFLPSGWAERVRSLEPFGKLRASAVDVYDVFLSKLFSNREKDRDDLRVLLPSLDRETIKAKLLSTCAAFLSDEALRKNAETNWYVLTGEALA
jgi:hypothetical protein